MRGIEKSENFFREYGKRLFEEKFPEVFPRLAFGLAGHGSECFGFDDDVSQDHDFTSGFAVWVSDEDEEKYGFQLMRTYSALLKEHNPGPTGKSSKLGEMEHGICRISQFFLRHIGVPGLPPNWQAWLQIPDYALAEALNGKVFLDNAGTFSALRNALRTQMPEDVRLKKIAAKLAGIAQAGQYNFMRCCAHNEPGAAALALSDFVRDCIALLFLLNRQFAPYYKWMFRAMKTLPALGELALPLEFLLTDNGSAAEKQALIEDICSQIRLELVRQSLSLSKDSYLEAHAFEVMKKIKNPQIRSLHVMV